MPAALAHEQPPGRKKPEESEAAKERSEDRVVKRGPPRSHLHRAAPSFSVPGPLATAAFTGGVGWGGRHAARRRAGEHEAQASGRESSSGRRRKAPGKRWLRRETTSSTGVRVSISESRSRLNASVPAARQRGQTRERSGMGRKKERSRGDCARRSGKRPRRCGGCRAPLSTEVQRSSRYMRASLVGIAPGGVRARRLGKSQGRERMTIRFDGRVPGPVDTPA